MEANNNRFYTGIASNIASRPIYAEKNDIRTEPELVEAEKEFFDKVWYVRHMNAKAQAKDGRISKNPKICRDAERAAQRIQGQYGNVQEWFPQDAYEMGYLNGSMAAIRWTLGGAFGDLDT